MSSKLRRFFDLGFRVPDILATPSVAPQPQDTQQALGIGLVGLVGASLGTLLAFALILLATAALLSFLRKKQNATYWEIGCWALVTVGVVARQVVRPDHTVNLSGIDPRLIISSGIVSLAVLPSLMRWVNRASPRPGLHHVAVPFSLGFFLDYAQVFVNKYIVHLPWATSA